jgi:anti-anti-sigma factor
LFQVLSKEVVVRERPRKTPLSGVSWIEIERHLDTSIIRLYGEFDLSAEKRFREKLDSALDVATATLVLDLRGLTFMDSTGLRNLVSLSNRAERDGVDFAVLCDEGNVRHVLRETGLDAILPVVEPSGALPASESSL